jgi:acetyl esterase/lipase
MTPLALDLVARGLAVWNVDYRGTGADGGGWPTTLLDVAAAVDHVSELVGVDHARVATCGHSAGGHLALWAVGRHRLPAGSSLAGPLVRPVAAVALAGVSDLVAGARERLGDGAIQALLEAEPDEAPERYAQASPAALLPLGARLLLVHGGCDEEVPLQQSAALAASAASAGDEVELRAPDDVDHFDVIDPAHPTWRATADWLAAALG